MSLQDIFKQYQVPCTTNHRHVRSGWLGTDCPLCSPGWGKYRLGFHLASGRSSCWVDGRQDSVVMLSLLCRIPVKEAAKLWASLPKAYTPQETGFSGTLQLPAAGPLLPAHLHYLTARGFDPDQIEKLWEIKGIGPGLKLQWRILIPVHDPSGRVVSWTTRAIGLEAPVRYVSASLEEESIPHKNLLYGAHHARHSIVVCEGPISAWAIGPGAVATLGVGYSEAQLAAIAEYPLRAICFDSEPAAQKRAIKLCRDLAAMPGTTENIELETGKDPAECEKEEILQIREQFLS